MQVTTTKLQELLVLEPEAKTDERGFFLEVYRKDVFDSHDIPTNVVQENHTSSAKNVLRGLHFQWEPRLEKLIRIIRGNVFAVAVDIRKSSPTLGEWVGTELSYENKKMMWVPAGFAAGFCVMSDVADVEYHYTALYNPKGESSILWNDPRIGIDWPVKSPTLSLRDEKAETLETWLKRPESDFFK
jgi:dTDP-4-dehydrorhamnose 3,5-epimerase